MNPAPARLSEILSNFGKLRVAVLGDLMLDEWIWGTVSRISPEAPVPVVEVEKRTYTPGGACNVAANLRSLGASAALAGWIGADDPGKILKRELNKFGVDTRAVMRVKNRPTTMKTRIIAHSQQVVRADVETRAAVDGRHEKTALAACRKAVENADAVLFSDYNKGFARSPFVGAILRETLSRKKPVAAGAKPSNLPLFRGIRLAVLNQAEAEQAAGRAISHERDLQSAGFSLLTDFNFEGLLITRGEHGMALFEPGKKMLAIPARASQVYDVSGAGDTVAAAAALALAAGASLREAAVLANHAAGVVVKKVGTATLTRPELRASFNEK